MFNGLKKLRTALFPLLMISTCLYFSPAHAENAEVAAADEWQFMGDLYLWATSINATTVTGGDIDIGFDELLRHLDMALMGSFGASKGKWTFIVDLMYANLSANNQGTLSLPGGQHGIEFATSSHVDITLWLVNLISSYNLVNSHWVSFDTVLGLRYLNIGTTLNLEITGPFRTRNRQLSGTGDVLDVVGGIRGKVNLNPKWYLPYYADVGVGNSELTWQLLGGMGYSFKYFDVIAGYRYIGWNFRNNRILDDFSLNGPLLGFKFSF